jgi:hypothetical protein
MEVEDFESMFAQALVVAKHGEGDQKPHGSWATGLSPSVAAEIQRFTREWGGLSISMVDGHLPTKGYMVAKPPEFSHVVDEADFFDPIKGPKILSAYMIKNRADLGKGSKNYLGTWLNGGKIYLDVSQNIMSKSEATKLGADRNQKKIWDVVNQVEIDTGGTGEVEKGNQSGGTARHFRDDGSGNRSIRPENLGEVSKAYRVIKFAAGLTPTFKHSGGEAHGGGDDQSSHGNWAGEGYSEAEIARISAMENVGLSIEDLNSMATSMEQAGWDDLILMVENDQGLYNQAIDGIDDIVDNEMNDFGWDDTTKHDADFIERQRNIVYEENQQRMINDFVTQDDGTLAQLWQEQNGGGEMDPDFMLEKINEVYGFEYTGKNPAGVEVSLRAEMMTITNIDENTLSFRGEIYNGSDDTVGLIERTFYRNETGGWNVEHDFFRIHDEESQGTGFGSKWIQRQEDWYIAKGFDAITVGTAWDGARHWARAGYDWDINPDKIEQSIGEMIRSVRMKPERFAVGTESRTEFDNLMSRMVVNYEKGQDMPDSLGPFKLQNFTNNDFPVPADFANIGINRKSSLTPFPDQPRSTNWDGKFLMADLNLKYKKVLTAEGTSINQGPIDRDGDGLVYDGTFREKPAPSK